MKIVGIGLNKTGITTLNSCLKLMGYSNIAFSRKAFEYWQSEDLNALFSIMNVYDSFVDWPWALMYKEIDKKFPGTKFILTLRKSPEIWYKSICNHALRIGPTIYRKKIYGYDLPHFHMEEYLQFYNDHILNVRNYFKNRNSDFLEVCWEEGDKWESLTKYLGGKKPDLEFPHMNKTPDNIKGFANTLRFLRFFYRKISFRRF